MTVNDNPSALRMRKHCYILTHWGLHTLFSHRTTGSSASQQPWETNKLALFIWVEFPYLPLSLLWPRCKWPLSPYEVDGILYLVLFCVSHLYNSTVKCLSEGWKLKDIVKTCNKSSNVGACEMNGLSKTSYCCCHVKSLWLLFFPQFVAVILSNLGRRNLFIEFTKRQHPVNKL